VVCKSGRDRFHKDAGVVGWAGPTMRLSSTILAALSLILMVFAVFFGVRSYSRYEGALRYGKGAPTPATAFTKDESYSQDFTGRSTGLLSYRGQLTYVSIVNPLRPEPWETWSIGANETPRSGPMILVWDVRLRSGLAFGSANTKSGLQDPKIGAAWQLPYRYFTVPYWLLALLFAILPYRWVVKLRQVAKWEREGRCPNCGTPLPADAAKCPGCGRATL
jgi:hypothetical protein